ncbi:ArsC family reductase [uncultured Sphingomonas sp.]|uniref:ArsC family reductase n=1 Tax=uncultured Sphingomonas sp. TaxID=158754 RepID=UPI001F986DF2|nr:ArsC family reductase [uncultured Sphingomonas sp.]HIV77965.1 ArsC family reductase [Candidatus Sphingomonas excrementigallinarum]
MTITLYGIPNCDTMKKARVWLDQRGVEYRFHNYKIEGIDEATLRRWVDQVGWERLLNRAGTTFRKLDETDRQDIDADKAIRLMQAQPSLIKRPVLDRDGTLTAGFKPEAYAEIF